MMTRFKRLLACGLALAATLLGSTAYALTDLTRPISDTTVTEDIKAVGTRDGDYGPKYLFDDLYGGAPNGDGSRWLGTFAPGEETSFTYIFKTPTVVSAVRLRVPAWNCNDRAPNDWTIFGSADEASWTQIHNQTDNAGTWAAQESRLYLFENEVAYKCYKIVINNIRKPAEGYVQLNEVEFYNTIRWTGAIDNDVTNPGNWEGDLVPGSNADVRFVGSVAPNIPAGTTFAVAAVYAQDVTLAEDCDWSGLIAPVSGKIDLKGHDLTVSTLAGDCEITDSTPLEQYERLEYIQSTGAQWIDTGVRGKVGLEATADLACLASSGTAMFLTSRNSSGGNTRFYQIYQIGGAFQSCLGDTSYVTEFKYTTGQKYHVVSVLHNGLQSFSVDDVPLVSKNDSSSADTGRNLYLFGCNENNGTATWKGSFRLYSCKITQDDFQTVLRDFVPVRRVRDGKVGLLDLANPGANEFYVNKGTGADFTAGSVKGTLMGEDLTASDGTITLKQLDGTAFSGSPYYGDPERNEHKLIDDLADSSHRLLIGDETGKPGVFKGCRINYDFGDGKAKIVRGIRFRTGNTAEGRKPKDVTVYGAQKDPEEAVDSDWTKIATLDGSAILHNNWSSLVFGNETAYRAYRLDISDNYKAEQYHDLLELWEMELVPGAASGELHVNVASGATVKTGSVTLSGSLKVVKKGDGALDFSKNNQPFTGGIDVVAGKIYTSASPSAWSFGGNGNVTSNATAITVNEGATFDLNGKGDFGYVTFNLNGGTIRGASNQFNAYVNLLADSYFETTGNTKIPWIKLYLNGFTLNVTIATRTSLYLADATIQNGTFNVVSGGTLAFNGERDFSTVDFKVGSAISASEETSVHDYEWAYSTGQWNSGSAKLKVFGTFTPTTDCFYGCEMQNGSTLNLASKTAAWPTTGTATAGLKSVTFANDATITVIPPNRPGKIIDWAGHAPDGSVTFKRAEGVKGRLIVKDNGLYLQYGLLITIK